MKTVAKPGDPGDFLAGVTDAPPRGRGGPRADHGRVTGASPVMWGGSILGFGDGEYTNTTGTHPWFRVGFSPRKAALALYVPGAVESELLADLGPHSTGKGCLYIKDLRAVDMSVLRQIIERGARA